MPAGHKEIVRLLLKRSAQVNARSTRYGRTALMFTSGEVGELLLEAGADIDARDGDNETALMQAAFFNNEPKVKWLLSHGANKYLTDDSGNTAQMTAELMGWVPLLHVFD